jgi:sugar lactone lactonase YvrE
MRNAARFAWVAALVWSAGLTPVPGGETRLVIEPVRALYGHLLEGAFLQPSGVYYDTHRQELYVADLGGRRIAIADRESFPTFSFGSRHTLVAPGRLVVDAEGRILVVDAGHPAVRVFDFDGRPLDDLDLGGLPDADNDTQVVALALDGDGKLYLLDHANRRVVVLDEQRRFVRAFSAPPRRDDLLLSPRDLDVLPDGRIVVSDGRGLAVQVYSARGKFLRGWGRHDVGMSNFSHPAGLCVDAASRIYVTDTLRQDVKVFSAEGEFITNFGGLGTRPGEVGYPVDVTTDRRGRLFVSERSGRRVQEFRVSDR